MEIYMPIKNFGGQYAITVEGRVISLKRGRVDFLEITKMKIGYARVILYRSGQKPLTCKVHRLVAEGFIPNPENKPMVNHIDGDKMNNNVDNLEWATPKENMQHAVETGLKVGVSGEDSNFAKLKVWQVKIIKGLLKMNRYSLQAIADYFLVSDELIRQIDKGLIWKNVNIKL